MSRPGAASKQSSQESWRGTAITIPQVLSRLNQLRMQAARADVRDGRHVHPRNSVLDLVVVASDNDEAEQAAAIMAELATYHPCRAIIVQDEPEGARSSIDATVTSRSHELMSGAVCQYEEVFLRVRGPVAEQIPSLVEAMLAPDVNTYLWWTGSPPLAAERFRQSLQVADVVVVDSARFADHGALLVALAEQAAERRAPVFADFNWARLHGWREVLAQFFNPRDRRSFLSTISEVVIERGGGVGNRSAVTLLAAWLATSLSWELLAAADRQTIRLRSTHGEPLEIRFSSGPDRFAAREEVVGVEIRTAGGDCLVHARFDPRSEVNLVLGGELWGRPLTRRVIPQESPTAGALLSHLLMDARGDSVYPRVLQTAAAMSSMVTP